MMDLKADENDLLEDGEVKTSEGQEDEDDFDIYKGFDIDDTLFENNLTDNNDEWELCLSTKGREEEKKEFINRGRKSKEDDNEPNNSSTDTRGGKNPIGTPREISNRKIPSLMSLKTEPPEFYSNRRSDRCRQRWRSSRNRDYDRGSPYRNRKEAHYDGRQNEKRHKDRVSDSRFKSNKK